MTPDQGPRPEPGMDLAIPFLGIGQTLVIRNEVSVKLLRFDTIVRKDKPVKCPFIKIFAPEDFDIYATRDGLERRMLSIFNGDGFGTTAVRLSPVPSRLNLGRYEIRAKPASLDGVGGLSMVVKSPLLLAHFISEGVPSRQIRDLIVRERQALRT